MADRGQYDRNEGRRGSGPFREQYTGRGGFKRKRQDDFHIDETAEKHLLNALITVAELPPVGSPLTSDSLSWGMSVELLPSPFFGYAMGWSGNFHGRV